MLIGTGQLLCSLTGSWGCRGETSAHAWRWPWAQLPLSPPPPLYTCDLKCGQHHGCTSKPGHFPGIKAWATQSHRNLGQPQIASPYHGVPGTQPSQACSQCPINMCGSQRWTTLAPRESQDQPLAQLTCGVHYAVMGICVQAYLPEPQSEPPKQGVGSPGLLLSVCTYLERSLPRTWKMEERLLTHVPVCPTHSLGPMHARPRAPSFCWTPIWSRKGWRGDA